MYQTSRSDLCVPARSSLVSVCIEASYPSTGFGGRRRVDRQSEITNTKSLVPPHEQYRTFVLFPPLHQIVAHSDDQHTDQHYTAPIHGRCISRRHQGPGDEERHRGQEEQSRDIDPQPKVPKRPFPRRQRRASEATVHHTADGEVVRDERGKCAE